LAMLQSLVANFASTMGRHSRKSLWVLLLPNKYS
jgi:hypothetical protein